MAKHKQPDPETEKREALIDPRSVKGPGEDFTELSSLDRCVGFFSIQSGNSIQGFLRGSFEVDSKFKTKDNNGKKRVYKIEVTSLDPSGFGPTIYMPAKDVDEEYPDGKPAEIGDLVGIDEKGFLQSLRKVEEGTEIWLCCYGKDPPSEAYPQGAWQFRVMVKAPVLVDETKPD